MIPQTIADSFIPCPFFMAGSLVIECSLNQVAGTAENHFSPEESGRPL
jgi:hypothetical protein